MKTNNDNIEDLFKEKFQKFEVSPPEGLWENISKEIDKEKESKKIIPFWYFGSGIAASLLLFFGVYLYFNTSVEETLQNQIVLESETDFEQSLNNSNKNNLVNEKVASENNLNKTITKTDKQKAQDYLTQNPVAKNNKDPKINKPVSKSFFKNRPAIEPKETRYSQNTNTDTDNKQTKKQKSPSKQIIIPQKNYASAEETKKTNTINNHLNQPTTDTQIAEAISLIKKEENSALALLTSENQETKPAKEKKSKKWSIQPQIGTFAYNNIGEGSSINSSLVGNSQTTETDISYSIRLAYQVAPKINIRSGIGNTNINITTSDIGIQSSSNNESFSEIFSDSNVTVVNLSPPLSSNIVSDEFETVDSKDGLDSGGQNSDDSITSGKINQTIQYLEFPIELAYKLIDKKIGLDIIGGFSTLILTKNESVFESINQSSSFGEASTINDTSFSSNIGFSINYNLLSNLNFNLEPMVKFQFNSVDNQSEYRPYLIGISSGVQLIF